MQQQQQQLLDAEFERLCILIQEKKTFVGKGLQKRVDLWVKKMKMRTDQIAWKKHRNTYAEFLAEQLESGELSEPFDRVPQDGPLPNFPEYVRTKTYRRPTTTPARFSTQRRPAWPRTPTTLDAETVTTPSNNNSSRTSDPKSQERENGDSHSSQEQPPQSAFWSTTWAPNRSFLVGSSAVSQQPLALADRVFTEEEMKNMSTLQLMKALAAEQQARLVADSTVSKSQSLRSVSFASPEKTLVKFIASTPTTTKNSTPSPSTSSSSSSRNSPLRFEDLSLSGNSRSDNNSLARTAKLSQKDSDSSYFKPRVSGPVMAPNRNTPERRLLNYIKQTGDDTDDVEAGIDQRHSSSRNIDRKKAQLIEQISTLTGSAKKGWSSSTPTHSWRSKFTTTTTSNASFVNDSSSSSAMLYEAKRALRQGFGDYTPSPTNTGTKRSAEKVQSLLPNFQNAQPTKWTKPLLDDEDPLRRLQNLQSNTEFLSFLQNFEKEIQQLSRTYEREGH